MRKDIVEFEEKKLSRAIQKRLIKVRKMGPTEALIQRDRLSRVETRERLIEPSDRDPNGYERVLGESSLCSINFLLRGTEASRAVARLRVRRSDGSSEWMGTGFLVAPGLLLTNHHVLATISSASLAIAEFNYEHDINGVASQRQVFNLMPSTLFFANADLDMSFVQVAPRSFEGMPLSDYGFLPLISQSGKGLEREWVSIIQHPGGQPKQISIRDSQVVKLNEEDGINIELDKFIHYSADTEPGSSGAPVFNDQWQVVALHHKAVPDYNEKGERLAKNGMVWTEEMGDSQKKWIANQGVRISAIYEFLLEKRFSPGSAGAVLERLHLGYATGRRPILSLVESGSEEGEFEKQGADSKPEKFEGRKGYDPNFLSHSIPLPKDEDRKVHQAKLLGKNSTELKYTHFSVVFDSKRRFARFTAVNIHGAKLVKNSGVDTSWRRDGRIDVDIQPDDNFYKKSIAEEKMYFQRGHLVRRVDPSWGTAAESKQAVFDTFHFTNAAPHQQSFNNTIWGDLEDYLLVKADQTEKKMTVFSGPLFRPSDPTTYGIHRPGGPYTVPDEYWKVAVIQKSSNSIAAAAFLVRHGSLLDALDEEAVFTGLAPYTPFELVEKGIQTTIEFVEEETGLSFGDLKEFDRVAGLESSQRVRRLQTVNDIII